MLAGRLFTLNLMFVFTSYSFESFLKAWADSIETFRFLKNSKISEFSDDNFLI